MAWRDISAATGRHRRKTSPKWLPSAASSGLGALIDKMSLGIEQPIGEAGWRRALTIRKTFAALDSETLQEAMALTPKPKS